MKTILSQVRTFILLDLFYQCSDIQIRLFYVCGLEDVQFDSNGCNVYRFWDYTDMWKRARYMHR